MQAGNLIGQEDGVVAKGEGGMLLTNGFKWFIIFYPQSALGAVGYVCFVQCGNSVGEKWVAGLLSTTTSEIKANMVTYSNVDCYSFK